MLAAGAAFLAASAGAKEVATYNRDNFKWDLEQRLERETWRIDMQVKRFELFREDVRDLVNLTVDRMDIYHLVGALFLSFCVVLFVEGRVHKAPPFILSLYLLSNACAFIYMLLAVWLSMHASIAAHSFGVRLLTRFVRLPIPSIQELNKLTYQLRDYETQGVQNVLRLPFLDRSGNKWKSVSQEGGNKPLAASSSSSGPSSAPHPEREGGHKSSSSSKDSNKPKHTGQPEDHHHHHHEKKEDDDQQEEHLLPEQMEAPIGGDDLLTGSSGAMPGRHVQLFRATQAKWQCYDAYCRVCMGMGLNQLLQGLSYYSVCHTIVENNAPSTGFMMVLCFQSTTVALAMLDLAGLKRCEIIMIQLVGMTPCLLAAGLTARAKWEHSGRIPLDYIFTWSPICMLLQCLWLELWLLVASPSGEGGFLPRRFRQVLFLDVFGDASGWTPGTGADDFGELEEDEMELHKRLQRFEKAKGSLHLAQSALRLWSSAPADILTSAQGSMLHELMVKFDNYEQHIRCELEELDLEEEEEELRIERPLRPWKELHPLERRMEPCKDFLIGPFEHEINRNLYYWDVDTDAPVFDDGQHEGAFILDMAHVSILLDELVEAAHDLTACRLEEPDYNHRGGPPTLHQPPRRRRCRRCCPNLASLIWERSAARAPRAALQTPAPILSFQASFAPASAGGGVRASFTGASLPGQQHDLPTASAAVGEGGVTPTLSMSGSLSLRAMNSGSASGHLGGAHSPMSSSLNVAPAALEGFASDSVAARRDPTFKAIAGQHAQHFVPERLPWMVLSWTTRMLQIIWILLGIKRLYISLGGEFWDSNQAVVPARTRNPQSTSLSVWSNYFSWQPDIDQDVDHPYIAQPLSFRALKVDWPHRSLFNAMAFFDQGRSTALNSPWPSVLLASPYALYQLEERHPGLSANIPSPLPTWPEGNESSSPPSRAPNTSSELRQLTSLSSSSSVSSSSSPPSSSSSSSFSPSSSSAPAPSNASSSSSSFSFFSSLFSPFAGPGCDSPFSWLKNMADGPPTSPAPSVVQLKEVRRLLLPRSHGTLLCSQLELDLRKVPDVVALNASTSSCSLLTSSRGKLTFRALDAEAGGGVPRPESTSSPSLAREGGSQVVVAYNHGDAWQHMAGVTVECSLVVPLMPPLAAAKANATTCAVLAGWTGKQLLVAVLPLRQGEGSPLPACTLATAEEVAAPSSSSSSASSSSSSSSSSYRACSKSPSLSSSSASPTWNLRPAMDLPLLPNEISEGIQSLHLVAPSSAGRQLRLWINFPSGRLSAWDLLRGRHLATWEPNWDLIVGHGFRPRSIFDGGESGLLVVGRRPRGKSILLQGQVPFRHRKM